MKRFHIALAVRDIAESVIEYTRRLGQEPAVVAPGRYAMWRTDLLNFSIAQLPEHAGELRHVGFEDSEAVGFGADTDVNGILWERFSPQAQDEKIVEYYGSATA